MLESSLSEFAYIKETLDKENDTLLFGRAFSFFSAEPTVIYRACNDKVVFCNVLFTDVLGFDESDFAATQYSFLQVFCKDDLEVFKNNIDAFCAGNYSIPNTTYCLLNKDGRQDHYHLKCIPFYKEYCLITIENVNNIINPASKSLLDAKVEELNRSNKELEEFAYIASHDLQEPLRKITTFLQRLQQKLGDAADEDIHLYMKRINVSADNMRNLIDNLLEFSRVSRNKLPAEHVELSTVVTNVLAELEIRIEEAGARIDVEPLPVVEAIPSQMQQLFHNLINNAIKFRKPDVAPVISIRQIEVGKEEKQQYSLDLATDYVMIIVSDNGIGFEPIYAEKIFQLFQRLHGKHEYPGTGIGLSICKKIVMNHHGHMFATGEPGIGSSFYIILPKRSAKDV